MKKKENQFIPSAAALCGFLLDSNGCGSSLVQRFQLSEARSNCGSELATPLHQWNRQATNPSRK